MIFFNTDLFQSSSKNKLNEDEIASSSEEEEYDESDEDYTEESDEVDEEDEGEVNSSSHKKRKLQLETPTEEICSIKRNKKSTVHWLPNGQVSSNSIIDLKLLSVIII